MNKFSTLLVISMLISSSSFAIINGQRMVRRTSESSQSVVKLELLRGANGQQYQSSYCTGTLVAQNVILTAGHCFDSSLVTYPTGAQAVFEIYNPSTGEITTETRKLNPPQVIESYRVHIPESQGKGKLYAGRITTDDLAIVSFQGDLPAGYRPSPIESNLDPEYPLSQQFVGYGFGRNKDYSGQTGEDAYFSIGDLYRGLFMQSTQTVFENTKINLGTNASYICQGDSGGPLFIESFGQFKLVGVNSYSGRGQIFPSGLQSCVGDGAGVTKLGPYSLWIKKMIRRLQGN